jgi:hypothetical protein
MNPKREQQALRADELFRGNMHVKNQAWWEASKKGKQNRHRRQF